MSTQKNKTKSSAPTVTEETPKVNESGAHSDAELLRLAGAFERKYATQIAARIEAGLTKEQAVEVQRAQVAHDLRTQSA